VQPRLQEVAGPLRQGLADDLGPTTALTVRDGEDAAVVVDVRSPRNVDPHITYRPGHPGALTGVGSAAPGGRAAQRGRLCRQLDVRARREQCAHPGLPGVAERRQWLTCVI
jgi:DNA-binding IclR family transcriptional regulator